MERLLLAEDVADILQVDKQRVYELVRTNQIPVVRLGERQYRFVRSTINAWLEEGGSQKEREAEDNNG